jgi:uncharacterized cupin superfamily protein
MSITIQKPSREEVEKKGISDWPIWEKDVSRFDWHYDSTEECYILEGSVEVTTKDGDTVHFGKGDFVTFPKGLSCTWNIKQPVRKHYNFR